MNNAKLTINLKSLQNNAKYLIDEVKKQSTENNPGVIAMVKNNAYNLGLLESVESFYNAGIRFFATTSIKDCIKIRNIYPDVEIICVNPSTEFDTLKKYNITSTLPSYEYIEKYIDNMEGISWHVEWAGNMRRSGCKSKSELIKILKLGKKSNININGLWTHFSWADTFDEEKSYEKERNIWINLLKEITKTYDFEYIHAQNSASFSRDGILPLHTHIRPGILLYGYYPHDKYENINIKPSIKLSGEIISIIKLKKGESIGYCSSFIAEEDSIVAVINIGYGDGLLRKRGIGHDIIINNKRYKLISFMMSHTVAKISSISNDITNQVNIGDRAYFYNEELPLHEFTKKGVGSCSEQMSPLNYNSLDIEYIK